MPKNKKPAPFMSFAMEYKKKQQIDSLNDAVNEAGAVWKTMDADEKAVYKDRISKSKHVGPSKPREIYTSDGTPLSLLENQQNEMVKQIRNMKLEIKETVESCRHSAVVMGSQRFYFIMANYFIRTLDDVFYPAEIALCEYSLTGGVTNKYHSFVNPDFQIYGHAFEAQQHAEKTHSLPQPPSAMGEKDMLKLYKKLLDFLCLRKDKRYPMPPVYTHKDSVPMIVSVLQFLKNNDQDLPNIRVYPIHHLFYTMKMVTAEMGDTKLPESIHITNAILDRDYYEYQSGISCNFHEEIDRSKYCALSCVVRWSFAFSDNMCLDLSIKMIPGNHLPIDADLTLIEDDFIDTKSSVSMQTSFTQPSLEKTYFMDSSFCSTGEHFTRTKVTKEAKTTDKSLSDLMDSLSCEPQNIENPWSTRNTKTSRLPTEDSFNLDFTCIGSGRGIALGRGASFLSTTSLNDDSNNSSFRTRGRGLLLSLANSIPSETLSTSSSRGRGNLFEK